MDVVVIFNGLGNQMSQYALYLAKKKISPRTRMFFSGKSKNIHNGYELERVFGIVYRPRLTDWVLYQLFKFLTYRKFPLLSRPLIGLLKRLGMDIVSEEDDYNFHPAVLKPSKGIRFYTGGWHSEKYFAGVKIDIRQQFHFDLRLLGPANDAALRDIRGATSVSVHVRRGDFMDADNYRKFGSVCTLEYFEKAIGLIRSRIGNPHFFFFTNDPQWVREHFTGDAFSLININSGADSWKDMFLISQCEHHISSNGSFSWWSAWLTEHQHSLVVVPKEFVAGRYFPDVYPDEWIRLSGY